MHLLALVFLNQYTYVCVSYIIVINDRIGHIPFKLDKNKQQTAEATHYTRVIRLKYLDVKLQIIYVPHATVHVYASIFFIIHYSQIVFQN